MNRTSVWAVFSIGAAAIAWIAAGYGPAHPLALTMTLAIFAFFALGAIELARFGQATGTLQRALGELPEDLPQLGDWLARLHPSLQNPVRLRIEGERSALPGPALTPYLVGLLVLLGMLGTFLGMVVTLNGTVTALESTTDLQAIRSSLAAPVKGLGLAFGTSVAGVAASAMLGLASALCRRERLLAAQMLDSRIATTLRHFSLGYSLAQQRQQALQALQQQAQAMPALVQQAQAMPALVQQLQALAQQMDRQQQALHERLLASQDSLQRGTEAAFTQLAASVDRTLQRSLAEGARLAGAAIEPAVASTMQALAQEAVALHGRLDEHATQLRALVAQETTDLHARVGQATHELHARIGDTVQQQLADLHQGFGRTIAELTQQWRDTLATHEQRSAEQAAALQATLAAQDQQRVAAFTGTLDHIAGSLQREWQQAGAQTLAQQQQICQTLQDTAGEIAAQTEAQARSTIAEIARLTAAATDAPRAAAEVIGQMREQFSQSLARDNALLDERQRMMAALAELLQSAQQSAAGQRSAIEAMASASSSAIERLVTGSQRTLDDSAAQFGSQLQAERERLDSVAAQVGAGAVEIASLGEAFGLAVQQFGESNTQLLAQLQRVETALSQSMARSDEQLAYYVAQAREIVDLSLGAQKQILDDLQRLARRAEVGTEAGAEA
ncbi:hypothetical protein [Aquabacterium sp.]|uniref:hypothetical protein n=1 Tax=Aquabacterium sp. TaxID=1872578 RepID=UPI0037838E06